ncbi:MAG: hypothetical protein COU07_00790 [Candidatus Harrisonbacteria bacterium CG10_big_fil_rev_8_21_14_0_10_40_38]|uniref:SCP domain-containing protein n=1 Tax=Candidatus Harrisonbacteria bacterium CG10_big_fil_rev_8_21_14_0_10_40_38 TaxID=1974583 RepID=A0A2H0USN7_9BACT|nr:MAG: hypothetical protein COU07_00790 [Candidatus Harrisonbacteria bacterium CG10_big_fil_rev_8_21_14_0_10_40_38]
MTNFLKKLFFIIFIAVSIGVFLFILKNTDDVAKNVNEKVIPEIKNITTNVEERIKSAPPLRAIKEAISKTELTINGVIQFTNDARTNDRKKILEENQLLDLAAQSKVNDMFEKQYFEHVGPDGRDVSDWTHDAGYEYISIGENLALGNFEGDKDLVDAWLASPGHRENILNSGFTEIGVAVKEGFYESKKTWLAVQVFGRPASDCAKPSDDKKEQIESNEKKLDNIQIQINSKRQEIENSSRKWGASYNELVKEYNNLVNEYNSILDDLRILIDTYNTEVNTFNTCIKS